jgi:hypothetical protein
MREESAVEPTRSENITVIWRRSASVGDGPVAVGTTEDFSADGGAFPILAGH